MSNRITGVKLKALVKTASKTSLSKTIKFTNDYSTKCFKKENFILTQFVTNNNNITLAKKHLFAVKHYSTATAESGSTTPSSNNNIVPRALNPLEYEEWSKEEVCSLLCTPKKNGGAGLSPEEVKPLYDAGFKGTSLGNIVNDIKKQKAESYIIDETCKSFPTIARDTIKTVVNWVDNLLKTRLYHLWSVDQVISHLCSSKFEGGAGLSEDQVKPFRDCFFNGKQVAQVYRKIITHEQLLENFTEYGIIVTPQLEKICESVVNWIMNTLHSKNLITITLHTFKKVPHYIPITVAVDETVMDKVDQEHLASSTKSSAFSEEELFLLEELSGMSLLNLDKAKDADSFVFDLKNREETINKVINHIKGYNQSCRSKQKLTKQDIPFLIAEGGSGSGKSRMLVELVNILRNGKIADEYQFTRIIYFNFTNGFNIDKKLERDQNCVSMITARIVYSAFHKGRNWADKLHGTNNNNMLYEVLAIIGKKLHEQCNIGMQVTIPVLLVLDEFQQATRSIPSLGSNIQHLISWYMRQFQKQHGLIIIPAIGGTITDKDIQFDATDHAKGKLILNLPCLREDDTKSLVGSDIQLKDYYTDRSKFIWDVIGYVPRHLEWAINYAKLLEGKEIPIESLMNQIYTHIAQQVLNLYGNVKTPDLYNLVLVCLSGLSQVEQFTDRKNYETLLEQFNEKGLLYKKNGKLQLPLILLDQIVPENNEFPKNVIQDLVIMSNNKSEFWEKLEELCLKTLVCRFSLFFSETNKNLVKFRYLFSGAIYPSKLDNVIVTAKTGTFVYSEIDTPLSESDIGDSVFKKTKKGERGVDGLGCNMELILSDTKSQNAVIVTQAKLQEENSDDVTYGPAEIAKFYKKALAVPFKEKEKYVLIVTNKKISMKTTEMIQRGKLEYHEQKTAQVEPCPNLIVISRECFSKFFCPFVADFLTTFNNDK